MINLVPGTKSHGLLQLGPHWIALPAYSSSGLHVVHGVEEALPAPWLAQSWNFPLYLPELIAFQGFLLCVCVWGGYATTGDTCRRQHSLAATLGAMSYFDNIPVDGGKIF